MQRQTYNKFKHCNINSCHEINFIKESEKDFKLAIFMKTSITAVNVNNRSKTKQGNMKKLLNRKSQS